MTTQEAELLARAAEYDHGDAKRIQHLVKVHDLAMTIATLEAVDERTKLILAVVSILHDIGTHEAERKYGRNTGPYQEKEGPAVARKLLEDMGGYDEELIMRVCWLIAHHHHVSDIHDQDHQILVEADYLVNLYEYGLDKAAALKVRDKVFRTATGKRLLNAMFDL